MKISWKLLVTTIFIVLFIAMQLGYWSNPVTVSDIIALHNELVQFIHAKPLISAVIYTGLYALSIIFGIPLSATFIGGYLFGIAKGLAYSLLGTLIGTTILCSLVRYAIGDWIQKHYKKQLDPLDKELKKYGLNYILLLHTIPFMPSFLPNVVVSISNIPLTRVIAISVLGALPLSSLYAIAGSYLHQVDSIEGALYYITIFGVLLGIVFLATLLFRRFILN